MVQIAILGTGMIGTSIGLALKDNPDVTIEKIIGYDRDKSNMRAAKKVGAVDDTEGSLHKAIKDASIIIFCNLSLFIFLTTVLSKIIGKNLVTPNSVAFCIIKLK